MKHLHLQIHADRYAELRQALGFKFRERGLVQQFVDFLEAQNCSGPIRTALALEWAVSASPSCGRCGQVRRLTVAWHFLIYLKAFLPDTEIPASGLLTEERRPRPYLYSSQEIVGMQQATRTLWEPGCLKQITFETLIGLLASTGLRIGEAPSNRGRSPFGFRPASLGDPQYQVRQVAVRTGPPQHCPEPAALPRQSAWSRRRQARSVVSSPSEEAVAVLSSANLLSADRQCGRRSKESARLRLSTGSGPL